MIDFNDPVERKAYRAGVEAAASFVGDWDWQVSGTPYRLSDLIRLKFNLVSKKALRKLYTAQGNRNR